MRTDLRDEFRPVLKTAPVVELAGTSLAETSAWSISPPARSASSKRADATGPIGSVPARRCRGRTRGSVRHSDLVRVLSAGGAPLLSLPQARPDGRSFCTRLLSAMRRNDCRQWAGVCTRSPPARTIRPHSWVGVRRRGRGAACGVCHRQRVSAAGRAPVPAIRKRRSRERPPCVESDQPRLSDRRGAHPRRGHRSWSRPRRFARNGHKGRPRRALRGGSGRRRQ